MKITSSHILEKFGTFNKIVEYIPELEFGDLYFSGGDSLFRFVHIL